MDLLWIMIGIILILVGLAGCVLPFLPGPPLCFIALIVQQLKTHPPFEANFLWIMAGVTSAVVALEFLIPIYGTKRYGGSKYGMWGCTIGLIAGLWLGPLGIIVGPFVGAFIGEMIFGADSDQAIRSAFGSFIGFLTGTLLKLIACFVMSYYFIVSL
jgi:uncharacterized protein YqgC (DUF456 family)